VVKANKPKEIWALVGSLGNVIESWSTLRKAITNAHKYTACRIVKYAPVKLPAPRARDLSDFGRSLKRSLDDLKAGRMELVRVVERKKVAAKPETEKQAVRRVSKAVAKVFSKPVRKKGKKNAKRSA
jgi:hypothetical protein